MLILILTVLSNDSCIYTLPILNVKLFRLKFVKIFLVKARLIFVTRCPKSALRLTKYPNCICNKKLRIFRYGLPEDFFSKGQGQREGGRIEESVK